MKYYAIADLHGRSDLFEKCMATIADHADCSDHEIIALGDYVDRGPGSKDIISALIKYGFNDGSSYNIALQGNHEAMMLETILTPLDPSWWIGNGGDKTLMSYEHPSQAPWANDWYFGCVPEDHLKFIGTMPLYYETPKQVFVHAGIPFPDVPLEEQDKEKMQWMLYSKNDQGWYQDKHVVHGHHQFADGPHTWTGRTDLDTFAWKTGRIVIGVFNDTQGPAVDFIEVKI